MYNDVVYYYQFNARGDVIALTDSAGNVVVSYDYDEWGNIVSMTGNQTIGEANPYRYVGKYGVFYDADSNMYLMGWRDYDPKTGRYIVPDEYEGEEDEPISLNRYLYAEGDPVNNIDPDGHMPKWLQKGWKATKKVAKKGYNFAIGDDIRTLRSKKSKWYQKAGATASIASNFIPGAGAAKVGIKAVKHGKKMKKATKFVASSVKKTRKAKLKAVTRKKSTGVKMDLQQFSKKKGHKSSSNNIGRRGNFRDAKRKAGIPNSSQHKKPVYVHDKTTENRLVYEFEVNSKKKYVVEHREDKFGRGPHFHGADSLKGSPLKKGRYNQYPGHSPEDFKGYRR